MKHKMWGSALAALLVVAGFGTNESDAGMCGARRYRCCPTPACAPCGDYCNAKACCTSYKTVKDVVWCQEEYCDTMTVYDHCVEKVPVTCQRTVYDTCYKDVPYTVCKPVKIRSAHLCTQEINVQLVSRFQLAVKYNVR
ncbi:MAG: hypothetical protein KDA79_03395, partial [Planctomycetaceae bacterium]|nr:hypothetical protein [Planctomycetaceae bacterium]